VKAAAFGSGFVIAYAIKVRFFKKSAPCDIALEFAHEMC